MVFLEGRSLSCINSCETKDDIRASKHNVASACPVNVAKRERSYMPDQKAKQHCMKKGTSDQQRDLASKRNRKPMNERKAAQAADPHFYFWAPNTCKL